MTPITTSHVSRLLSIPYRSLLLSAISILIPPLTHRYEYQDFEWRSMKSSVMPDKNKDLDTYPDAVIANRASEQMRNFVNGKASRSGKGEGIHKYWMTGVGFKMPHTALHVPYKYYQMYVLQIYSYTYAYIYNPTQNICFYALSSLLPCCAYSDANPDSHHHQFSSPVGTMTKGTYGVIT